MKIVAMKTASAVVSLVCLFVVMLPFPPAFAAEEKGVTVNFVDVELVSVAKFISDVTGKNLIFDDRVKGKITIIAPTKLQPDAAFSLFTSVLGLKGLALVPVGVDAYKIVPAAEAKQSGVGISSDAPPMDENFIVRLIPLQHISSDEALNLLKPVVSKEGHISSFGPGNLLLVVDSGLNVEKVLGIVRGVDMPPVAEEPEVVMLQYASADTVASILSAGQEKKGRKPDEAQAKAVSDTRLNAVVLVGGRAEREAMKRLITLLDVEARKAQSTINVYFLENADAEELAEVLDKLLKGQKAAPAKTEGKPSTASPFEAVSGINITPDKATNAIVVVSSPADYQSLAGVIRQLDKRRKQVYVEALIVEASLDKVKDLGLRWRASITHDGEPVLIGGVGTIDDAAFEDILTGLSGFTLGGAGNFIEVPTSDGETLTVPGFAALFSLSDFEGVVNVLSSPQILTSDNSEAEIVVGENVPFISQSESDATTGDTILNSIERKDVGIKLKLTPQITEGDYIKLELYQEISAVQETSEDIFTSVGPTLTKRSTSTTVVVRDNQTVVIGGLMQETEEKSTTKMPWLGDIPLIGWLFKYMTDSKEKTNLLVFLTPHVVKDSGGMGEITRQKRDSFARDQEIYAEGELLVGFHSGTPEDRAVEVISMEKAVFVEYLNDKGLYRIRLPKEMDVEDAVKKFRAYPEVASAGPDYKLPEMSLLQASAPGAEKPAYVEGELLVRFNEGVDDRAAERLIEGAGASVLKRYEGLDLYLVRLREGQPVEDAMAAFGAMPEVRYAEPNYMEKQLR